MSRKVKVMTLIWKINTGGAERMVVSFHNAFANDPEIDMHTFVFTPRGESIFESEINNKSESVHYIPAFWGDKIPFVSKVIRYLFYKRFRKQWFLKQVEEYKPDVIHIHLAYLAAELTDACKRIPNNIKILYHMHSMPEAIDESFRKKIRSAIEKKLYSPICVTELQRSSAVKLYNISEDTQIVRNGIDTSRFVNCDVAEKEIRKLKSELGIGLDEIVMGCVGRGAPIKNYPLLASAAGILSQSLPVCFLVVGEVPEILKSDITQKSQGAKVIFAGQRADTERMYRLMDVFCISSYYESSSMVTVEAQLSGIPCVISDRISDEVIISTGVIKVSPEAEAQKWAEAIKDSIRKEVTIINKERFAFDNSIKALKEIYLSR